MAKCLGTVQTVPANTMLQKGPYYPTQSAIQNSINISGGHLGEPLFRVVLKIGLSHVS